MRRLRQTICLFCGLALTGGVAAQRVDTTYFAFTYANDFFTATDYYFTQGLDFEYVRHGRHFRLVQEGYTPTSIRADTILRGDRPYAGALYLSYGVGQSQLAWSLDLGVIGPASLAEAEQKYIHRQTGNIEPRGWRYQIRNDLILNANLSLNHTLYAGSFFNAEVTASFDLGTYRIGSEWAAEARAGLLPADRWFAVSLLLRPSVYFVGYDASLQGGVFAGEASPYTLSHDQLRRSVGKLTGGVELRLGRLRLAFSHTYIGRTFVGGRRHGWGTIGLGYAGK